MLMQHKQLLAKANFLTSFIETNITSFMTLFRIPTFREKVSNLCASTCRPVQTVLQHFVQILKSRLFYVPEKNGIFIVLNRITTSNSFQELKGINTETKGLQTKNLSDT